jgi:hypothetical protein
MGKERKVDCDVFSLRCHAISQLVRRTKSAGPCVIGKDDVDSHRGTSISVKVQRGGLPGLHAKTTAQ